MDKIQIKNIRSLKDTGLVSLSPITLLVGENSSGKSTFLRIFPLLKQSIQKKTNGPILWAGDSDDYVDFGSFQETITDNSTDCMELKFSFRTQLSTDNPYYWFLFRDLPAPKLYNIEYSITIKKSDDREQVSALNIKINDTEIFVGYNSDSSVHVKLNDRIVEFNDIPEELRSSKSSLFWRSSLGPRSIFGFTLPNISHWVENNFIEFFEKQSDKNGVDMLLREAGLYLLGDALVTGVTLLEVKEYVKNRLGFSDSNSKQKKTFYSSEILPFIDELTNFITSVSDVDAQKFLDSLILYFFYSTYPALEQYINIYFRQVHYIAPLRATAERYYRLRNSAIDEVDYQGKNLAIFLNSLPLARTKKFQEWTLEHFGFKTHVEKTEGHLSIAISLLGSNKKINLSDTGFGYSQILPIITQLWELSSREIQREEDDETPVIPLIVAIEQPELHLHPAMQAKLAGAFIACIDLARKNGYQLQLILETHSQTIVNYFGRAIAENRIIPDDIALVLFERNLDNGYTTVSSSNFDSDGFLQDWPIGFFAPKE